LGAAVSGDHLQRLPAITYTAGAVEERQLCISANSALISLKGETLHFLVIGSQEIYMQDIGSNDLISSDKVEGTAVYNIEGDKLGSVDDLIIDKRSGHVRYAVLEFGGFLGMGTDRYPMPWGVLKYDTAKEGYVVPLDKARIERAPRYSESDTPAYTQEYGSKVNGYYGVDF
jgi:sporulation protein YlmC with PRC-barrel domain